LNPVKNDVMKAYCRFCKVHMISELLTIKKHANTSKHKGNFISMTDSKSITSTLPKIDETAIRKNNAVKVSEIKLCGFLSEHKVSFLAVDHLSQLLKECFVDSEIAKKY
ncbi:E3 SUMO-protein ligase KIAA1586-like, partial [Aphis craccivora]